MSKPKLKLAYLLPAIQIAAAVAMLGWGTAISTWIGAASFIGDPKFLCYAINAPALVTRALEMHYAPLRWLPPHILHIPIDTDDLLFLVCIFVLWLLIGLAFDNWNNERKPVTAAGLIARLFGDTLLILWSVYLLRAGMHQISLVDASGSRNTLLIFLGSIYIAWSFILTFWAVLHAIGCLRRRRLGAFSGAEQGRVGA